MTKITCN